MASRRERGPGPTTFLGPQARLLFIRAQAWRERGGLIPLTGGGGRKCLLGGRLREQRSRRKPPSHPLSMSPLYQGGQASTSTGRGWRGGPWDLPHPCLPTSDDEVLQGRPGIGEVPLLACLLERGRHPVLVGQDLVGL